MENQKPGRSTGQSLSQAFAQMADQSCVLRAARFHQCGIEVVQHADENAPRIRDFPQCDARGPADSRVIHKLRLWMGFAMMEAIDNHRVAILMDSAEEMPREIDRLDIEIEAPRDKGVDHAESDRIGFAGGDAPSEIGVAGIIVVFLVAAQLAAGEQELGKLPWVVDFSGFRFFRQQVEGV